MIDEALPVFLKLEQPFYTNLNDSNCSQLDVDAVVDAVDVVFVGVVVNVVVVVVAILDVLIILLCGCDQLKKYLLIALNEKKIHNVAIKNMNQFNAKNMV